MNNDIVTGRIIQRILEAKKNRKHLITHGISYNLNPYTIINNIKKYCSIRDIILEELPFGYKLILFF